MSVDDIEFDDASGAIDTNALTGRNPCRGGAGSNDSRNPILPGDNRAVTERATGFGHYPCRHAKQG